jgi:hypothetical protein
LAFGSYQSVGRASALIIIISCSRIFVRRGSYFPGFCGNPGSRASPPGAPFAQVFVRALPSSLGSKGYPKHLPIVLPATTLIFHPQPEARASVHPDTTIFCKLRPSGLKAHPTSRFRFRQAAILSPAPPGFIPASLSFPERQSA